jgi:hypothetical protein
MCIKRKIVLEKIKNFEDKNDIKSVSFKNKNPNFE